MNQVKSIFAVTLLLLFSGCASMFMVGGVIVTEISPGKTIATYKIPQCKNTVSGSIVKGPKDGIYKIVETENGPILYELSKDGEAWAMTNYWKDENGMNFVGYIRTSHAYHFIIPDDKSKPAERNVYFKNTYTVEKVDGVLKITKGIPTAKCKMILQ